MARIKEELRLYRRGVIQARYEEEGAVPIAKDLGVCRDAVLKMAKRMGLQYKDKHNKTAIKIMAGNKSCFHDYFETWSENMAYCLGYIYADGHIRKYALSLACHTKDEEIIFAIREELRAIHRIIRKEPTTKHGRNNGPKTVCSISSKRLVKSLESYGLVQRKTFEDIPVPNVPMKFFGHFLRGYSDGDGHIGIREGRSGNLYGTFSMVGTPIFIEGMKERICLFTDVLRTKTSEQKTIRSIKWCGFNDLKQIYSLMHPPGEYIYLKRKKDVFDRIMELKIKPVQNVLKYKGV